MTNDQRPKTILAECAGMVYNSVLREKGPDDGPRRIGNFRQGGGKAMAQKLLKAQKRKVAPVRGQTEGAKKVVLVGTYAGDQLEAWPKYYPYPLSADDQVDPAYARKVNELWLFKGTKEPRYFDAECLGVKTRDELKALGYPAKGKGHGDGTYLLFKIEKTYAPANANASAALAASVESVIVRTKDFAKRCKKFSGAMGLDNGIDRSGMNIRLCVEFQHAMAETIRANKMIGMRRCA